MANSNQGLFEYVAEKTYSFIKKFLRNLLAAGVIVAISVFSGAGAFYFYSNYFYLPMETMIFVTSMTSGMAGVVSYSWYSKAREADKDE